MSAGLPYWYEGASNPCNFKFKPDGSERFKCGREVFVIVGEQRLCRKHFKALLRKKCNSVIRIMKLPVASGL